MREIKFEYISEFERFNYEKGKFENYFIKEILTLEDIEKKIFSVSKTLVAKRQYTGLKDKNGVEIYEGDILTHNGFEHYPVVFHKGAFCIDKIIDGLTNDNHYYLGNTNLPMFRVSSNIYENPELLESTK